MATPHPRRTRAVQLRGRRGELRALDDLVAAVRAGQSQVLVVRGEAGAGKTALLEYLLERASGCCIARTAGVESEMELAFAGLHQLCAPFLDRLERLPGPQRDALSTAFNLRDGDTPDRFAVGLAVLSLLSEVAGERPLVCVVDDAHWLDLASAQALAFVARHLAAKPAAVVFAVREPGAGGTDEQDLTGLAELVVRGLADGDARALLESAVTGPLDERVRDRIVAETRGNPLALLELARGVTPEELAGGFGSPGRPRRAGSRRASGGGWRRSRRRPGCSCWSPRPSRSGTRCWCGGRQVSSESRSRPRRRRPRPGSSSSAGRCGSVIRWPARRSTGRPRRRNARASTVPSPRPSTLTPTPIAARGTVRTRPPGSTRASRPSSSARPAGPGSVAAWRRPPPSASAPPS